MKNNRQQKRYKKEKPFTNKKSLIRNPLSLILRFNLAVALFFVFVVAAKADVVVQGGNIDVDSKLYVDPSTSNVGIGTTAPVYKLHVQGGDIYSSSKVRGETGLCIGSDCRTAWPAGGGSSLPSGTFGQTLRHDGTNWVVSSLLNNTGLDFIKIENNNEVYLDLRNSQAGGKEYALVSAGNTPLGLGSFAVYDKTADVARLVIDSSGNIGIGIANPNDLLEVVGNVRVSNSLNATSINTTKSAFFAIASGNVGIGTTTPGAKLDVVGGAIHGDNGLTISSGTVSLPAAQIDNAELVNPSLTVTAGSGLSGGGLVSLGGSTSLSLNTGNANTWSAAQTFSANTNFPGSGIWNTLGSVGIGTLTPSQKLDVAGGYIKSDTGLCIGSDCRTSWPAGGGSAACPVDMIDAGIYCIEPNERAATGWGPANTACNTAGRRLCTAAEWRYACDNLATQVLQLTNGNNEWSSDIVGVDPNGKPIIWAPGLFGASSGCGVGDKIVPGQAVFRCCLDN